MPSRRKFAISAAVLVAVALVGAALFVWFGVYNVAASRGHLEITNRFLEIGMRRSVTMHSLGIEAPPLDDPEMIKLGASAYQGGCALCHGYPGERPNPLVQRMLPSPPDLSERVRDWEPEQLFWIVKHGLKYTGMPAWTTQRRDDEVWSLVALLVKLPGLSPEQYRELARGNAKDVRPDPAQLIERGTGETALAVCARCHGDGESPPTSQLVPKLAGLPAPYIELMLKDYAEGKRHSGIMQPVTGELDPDDRTKLAAYYAALPRVPNQSAANSASPERIERGRKIAQEGIPANGVPGCVSCHAGGALATYPPLAGQNARYMAGQLRLWKSGARGNSGQSQIMEPIATRLSEAEIEDVSAYFASQQLGAQLSDASSGEPAGR
jgi:cytochrome c553